MQTDDPAALFVITGVCASGKTTVAELLAERFDRAAVVHGDVLRRMVVRGRDEMTPAGTVAARRALHLRHHQGAVLARSFIETGHTTVLEDVILDDLPSVLVAATATTAHVIALVPSAEVVLDRDRGREKRAYQNGSWDPADLTVQFRICTPRIGLWLDTSEFDPAATVSEILKRTSESAVDVRRL